jgi:hypothetical protein
MLIGINKANRMLIDYFVVNQHLKRGIQSIAGKNLWSDHLSEEINQKNDFYNRFILNELKKYFLHGVNQPHHQSHLIG